VTSMTPRDRDSTNSHLIRLESPEHQNSALSRRRKKKASNFYVVRRNEKSIKQT
jgi:hypothetical protein